MLSVIPERNKGGDSYEEEVQRPYSQNTANVERLYIKVSSDFLFTNEKRGDQICAQRKEKIHPECTGARNRANNWHNRGREKVTCQINTGIVGYDVKNEHTQERKESQSIQFRAIKASPLLLVGGRHSSRRICLGFISVHV